MEPFTLLDSPMFPVPRPNVDTDQILPALYLQKPRSDDFGRYLFRATRFAADGSLRPEAPLNRPEYRGARILVAGPNFACGSSREHAVWALYDYGFRAVIAPGLGDIFRSNALKNGLLPVVLPMDVVSALLEAAQAQPGVHAAVDLEAQIVRGPDGAEHRFAIDAFARHCLLEGLDEIDYTLTQADRIAAFEKEYAG